MQNKIIFTLLTDTDERREKTIVIAKLIQKEFDDKNYSITSETNHQDIGRCADDIISIFNIRHKDILGQQLWYFVEFTPENIPTLVLKFSLDDNENCLAELRRKNIIA